MVYLKVELARLEAAALVISNNRPDSWTVRRAAPAN